MFERKTCKGCDKPISMYTLMCMSCGKSRKRLFVVAFVIFIIAISNEPPDQDDPEAIATETTEIEVIDEVTETPVEKPVVEIRPQKQIDFIQVIADHLADFENANNELQESVIRNKRKSAISAALGGYTVNSWIGEITRLGTNTEGKANLSVRIAPDITIETWNFAFGDYGYNTLIEMGTPVYDSLLNLSKGQRVKVSGTFFASEIDFVEESSSTIAGSMEEPEFWFKFSSVVPIDQEKDL